MLRTWQLYLFEPFKITLKSDLNSANGGHYLVMTQMIRYWLFELEWRDWATKSLLDPDLSPISGVIEWEAHLTT